MIAIYEDPDLVREQRALEAIEVGDTIDADDGVQWIEPRDEAHWHELRAKNINSTESSALFGLSPYNTKFEIWHRKKDGAVYTLEDNSRMAWGRRLQDAIAYGVGEERGWMVAPLKEYAVIPSLRMGSSFDFQAHDQMRGTGILEIKNVDYSVYKREWLDDEAPDHIEIQLQHQLEISGYPWGCIAALVGGNTLKLIIRERDKEMGAAIRQEIEAFWQTIDLNAAPAPDFAQDADTIARLYAKSGGGERSTDDPRLELLARQYLAASEDEKISVGLKEAAAAEIKTLIGDADAVFCNGYKIGAKAVAANPGTTITPEMVGQVINARKGYRPIRISQIKEKK